MGYDYVKGYKAPLDSLPKDVKKIVKQKMIDNTDIKEEFLDDIMFEIDVYMNIDIRNYYDKKWLPIKLYFYW